MKKAILFVAVSSLSAILFATILNVAALHVGTQVVEAQTGHES
jgi:hypothetical protein